MMMTGKTFRSVLFGLLVLSLIALSGCTVDSAGRVVNEASSVIAAEGQVIPLQLRSTLWGMQQAMGEGAGTMLLQKDSLVTFVWSLRGGWAFAVIDTSSETAVYDFARIAKNGNIVNPKTMSDLTQYLQDNGWKTIPASALPPSVVSALSGGASWLTFLATSMTTFLVVPADLLTSPDILREYEEATAGIDT